MYSIYTKRIQHQLQLFVLRVYCLYYVLLFVLRINVFNINRTQEKKRSNMLPRVWPIHVTQCTVTQLLHVCDLAFQVRRDNEFLHAPVRAFHSHGDSAGHDFRQGNALH